MIRNLLSQSTSTSKREKEIFNLIRREKTITRKELLVLSHFKIATLYRIIDNLLSENLIVSGGVELTGNCAGRPSELFSINKDMNYIVGICIERYFYKLAIMNLSGEFLSTYRQELTQSTSPQVFVEDVYQVYQTACLELALDTSKMLGLGVGTVGPINLAEGSIVGPYLFKAQGWDRVPLCKMLQPLFKMPVLLDNMARAGIVGEYEHLYTGKYANLAYVTVGRGIGSALIVNGNVVRGQNMIINGLGHMVVDIAGRKCNCGNYGCVETYVTIPAILSKISTEMKKGRKSSLEAYIGQPDFDMVCKAAAHGDELTVEVVEEAAFVFTKALMNFLRIVELEAILFSGELLQKCELFYTLTKQLLEKALEGEQIKLSIHRVSCEEDSVLRGAASLVFDNCLSSLLMKIR